MIDMLSILICNLLIAFVVVRAMAISLAKTGSSNASRGASDPPAARDGARRSGRGRTRGRVRTG